MMICGCKSGYACTISGTAATSLEDKRSDSSVAKLAELLSCLILQSSEGSTKASDICNNDGADGAVRVQQLGYADRAEEEPSFHHQSGFIRSSAAACSGGRAIAWLLPAQSEQSADSAPASLFITD